MVRRRLQDAGDQGDRAAARLTGVVTADEIIARLGLQPHPEGGHYRETFRAADRPRGASTAIYFLLKAGERSHWHRVDADEVWHHYAGAPIELSLSDDGHAVRYLRLGSDLDLGELPQAVVPRGVWQTARSLGHWTLVGCTVAPAFEFEGFDLAPPDWKPS
jgi:predicted cupin superfamily sugar epimerase